MPAQEATISSFGTPRRRPSAVHENASAALPDCHDYLNPLIAPPAASDGRSRSSQPRRWAIWLWIALWLTALAPRLWVATRLDTICNDAVFYIQLAEGYQRGDVEAGLGRLRLNTYPPVLAMLHRAGLDWELAGKCWGVLLASLAVLPLAGWLRRQFDDRLALVACVLYAFHPKLIECRARARPHLLVLLDGGPLRKLARGERDAAGLVSGRGRRHRHRYSDAVRGLVSLFTARLVVGLPLSRATTR
jgi:hypothetical protein